MRTIYWYIYFGISLLFKIPPLYRMKRKKASMPREEYETAVNNIVRDWAAAQVRNSGARVEIVGQEHLPEGPVLFVSNHQSNFDIAIFLACIPKNKGYISKAEMKKIPVMRSWMEELRCVFMDRSNLRASMKSISDGVAILKDGYSLVICPEGTRSKGNPPVPFKGGSFKLATKAKVPIVPVTIDGAYRIMEANGNRIKPADVLVTIHPPVETAGLTKEEESALPQQVQAIIESAVKR